MQVQFWGTRGSIPKPGPTTIRYGGNTSCVEVRTERGTLIIIDGGSGLHGLGLKLLSGGRKDLVGHVLISHTHWDHIQGVPFFAPFFVPGHRWDVYGPKGLNQSLRDTLAGQMQHTYFPVSPDQFGATIRYHDLVEGTFEIDDVRITAQYLNHPALTLGYRLEADGATFVYCCDHEPFSRAAADGAEFVGLDKRHADFIDGADLLVHDAQYTAAEYPAKIGWGHSSHEFVVRLAQRANVKHVALTHHDPLRADEALERIVEGLKVGLTADLSPLVVSAAAEGETIVLTPSHRTGSHGDGQEFDAMTPVEPALVDRYVLVGVGDAKLATAVGDAAKAEGLRVARCASLDAARSLVAEDAPSLALVDDTIDRDAHKRIGDVIRETGGDQIPVVMVAHREADVEGAADWLVAPFTESFARAKIRAWVLREACRWARAPFPKEETKRLEAIRALGLLDTDPEERFDRITRLALALFNVPIATIGFVDERRQWFKSSQGLKDRENSRDEAFCAHVVHSRAPMIVPDALLDARFAHNPLVLGEPRIRFYAGHPLILADGHCVGTLCLIDTRPRTIEGDDLARFRDLAGIALDEIQALNGKRIS